MSDHRLSVQVGRTLLRQIALVDELRAMPNETEWLEFKRNNFDHAMIGERISALSNAARLLDRDRGYIIWGVDNNTHAVVGTDFDPDSNVASQPYKLRLMQHLAPAPALAFHVFQHPDGRVVLLEIPAANELPVSFDGIARIRVGSATPPLHKYPEIEKKLLSKLQAFVWERGMALEFVAGGEVLDLLDHDAYLRLRGLARPTTNAGILERLCEGGLIAPDAGGRWNILNLGAILVARQLDRFPKLERKALRIIHYNGRNRLNARPEQQWLKGYATGFEEVLRFLEGILPAREVIGALRANERAYPSEAVKEMLANALIHQDMTVTGTGPKAEVFEDRIEFNNPGEPVTDWRKLFGAEPRSRNEALAFAMRKMDLCEERGSGLRRIIAATNSAYLLPPDFKATGGATRVVLYGHGRDFDAMDQAAKIRSTYYYAMLLWEEGKRLTNISMRERFNLGQESVSKISVLLRACVEGKWIKVADPQRPNSGYIPFWS